MTNRVSAGRRESAPGAARPGPSRGGGDLARLAGPGRTQVGRRPGPQQPDSPRRQGRGGAVGKRDPDGLRLGNKCAVKKKVSLI